ncbi:hypothetical protein GCM10011352_10730 [Marinobacterium zhoushanense]|uniref:Uncharacterized protein n=1 Tax=Marinobacterium zhoushanense TaxID=1679163 RepID=A0ABQ1K396_9GAMM|nr:hypothetical protein [Marinobacterium zhoushanense]GGB86709.1 hypothetical protein GCM10011352_10730 [Marinobacterium zhoushanense]
MTVALKISDQSTSGETVFENLLHFPAEVISVRQLIEARVQSEVERYNTSDRGRFMGLIQPSDSERALNGFKVRKKRRVDLDAQQKIAIKAFQSNGFFLLVNDRQLTELDDRIFITPTTSVVFLKLTPLVGG